MVESLTRRRVESEEASVGGEYLPLSVWKARGFDEERIEKECKDIQDNAILGKCYRIQIKGVWTKTVEDMVRKELLEGKRPAASAPKRKSESPGSSDPSSSSSSKKKKNTKGKKEQSNKKGKQDKSDKKGKQGANGDKKTDGQAGKAAIRLATRIIANTSSLIMLLQQGIGDPHAKNVPAFALDPAKASLAKMKRYHDRAETCIKQRGAIALDWGVPELDADFKAASESAALVGKMLETARKHAH